MQRITLALVALALALGIPASAAAWPGQPASGTYIGLHGDTSLTGPVQVNRTYYQWGDDAAEDKQIRADHAAGRLPWVSFKAPSCGVDCIINGSQDAAIRSKGLRYAAYGKPVVTTFFHEPVGDVTAAKWSQAFLHIRTVMRNANGGTLGNATFAPILNGYLWADWYRNGKGTPAEWVDPVVLKTGLFGVDNYGETHEQARMLDYLTAHGARAVGIAEFGKDHGAADFQATLDLYASRPIVEVVCYFNSRVQEFQPGDPELAAFRNYLATSADVP